MPASYKGCFHRLQSGAPFSNTALSAAFLKALVRLVARRPDHFTKITLPTGAVTIGELELVFARLGPDPKRGNGGFDECRCRTPTRRVLSAF